MHLVNHHLHLHSLSLMKLKILVTTVALAPSKGCFVGISDLCWMVGQVSYPCWELLCWNHLGPGHTGLGAMGLALHLCPQHISLSILFQHLNFIGQTLRHLHHLSLQIMCTRTIVGKNCIGVMFWCLNDVNSDWRGRTVVNNSSCWTCWALSKLARDSSCWLIALGHHRLQLILGFLICLICNRLGFYHFSLMNIPHLC